MISILIPVWNRLPALENVLAAFCAMRKAGSPAFEVLLIDNNSTDDVRATWLAYREALPELRLVHQPPLDHPFALCRARNLGLELARNPWVATLDADCIPNPDYLRNASAALRERSLLVGERVFIDEDDVVQARVGEPGHLDGLRRVESASNYRRTRDRRFPELQTIAEQPHPWALCHGGNLLFPKQLALEVGGFDEHYDGCWGYEDIEFAWRLIRRGACTPRYEPGLAVYHQEGAHDRIDRNNKLDNRNWHRICATIPGYEAFKTAHYRRINRAIRTTRDEASS